MIILEKNQIMLWREIRILYLFSLYCTYNFPGHFVTKKNITLEILPPLYAVMNGVVQKVGLKLTVYSSGT